MTDSTSLRPCSKCGRLFPPTTEHFHKDKTKPDGLYPGCKGCRQPNSRRQYERDGAAIRARSEARRVRRRDERRAQQLAAAPQLEVERLHRQEARRLKHTERERQRYLANPEKFIAYQSRRRKNNPDLARKYSRVSNANRRARRLAAEGTFTKADVIAQYESQNGLCWWCGTPLDDTYEPDHRIPLARGGSNRPENIVVSCRSCNRSKQDKLPHEWNGRLL